MKKLPAKRVEKYQTAEGGYNTKLTRKGFRTEKLFKEFLKMKVRITEGQTDKPNVLEQRVWAVSQAWFCLTVQRCCKMLGNLK